MDRDHMSVTDILSTPLEKVISADSHVIEPPDVWSSRLTGEFRERLQSWYRTRRPTGSSVPG